MYIKITDNGPQSYSIHQLMRDNPQVSFPQTPSDSLLATYDVYPVTQTPQPSATETEVVESAGYQQDEDGNWKTAWTVRPMTSEELTQLNQSREHQRQSAYQREADPLFFKWKRGESDEQTWLDKIAEIKARYPDAT